MPASIPLKIFPTSEKPRERLILNGEAALTDSELLALIIQKGGKTKNVLQLSFELMSKYKSLDALLRLDIEQLKSIKHIGQVKAVTLKAVLEISKRLNYKTNLLNQRVISSPKDIFELSHKFFSQSEIEKLYLVSLDSKKRFISIDLLAQGSINETLVPIREVFRTALLKNAVHIILVHNHPSNDPTPSTQDLLVTQSIAKSASDLGIVLLDHVIVCEHSYKSIKELNIFETIKLTERG